MTRFVIPDPEILAEVNHSGMARIPVLLDDEYDFRENENRYLRERANLEWPVGKYNALSGKGAMATTTLVSIARRLQHFAEWRDRVALPLAKVTYAEIRRYEDDQRSGRPPFRRKVSAVTAASSGDIATDFMVWASHNALAGSFSVKFSTSWRIVKDGRSSVTPTVEVRRRPGRTAGPNSSRHAPLPKIPEMPEIADWLSAVEAQRGRAKYLICRFMVQTGVRLDEAVSLRVAQWPTTEDIRAGEGLGSTSIRLTKTKGMVKRTIHVPYELSRMVREWIDDKRPSLSLAASDRTGMPPERLFLSDRDGYQGMPIERHTVYDCFREVKPHPAGWHPHMVRHAYTCHYMRAFVLDELSGTPADRWPQFVQSRGEFALHTLRSQLGHVSPRTTEIYLKYLRTVFGLESKRSVISPSRQAA